MAFIFTKPTLDTSPSRLLFCFFFSDPTMENLQQVRRIIDDMDDGMPVIEKGKILPVTRVKRMVSNYLGNYDI